MRLKEDPGSQQQQQEGPNGYGDRTFENQGDSKQEHTVQEDEPNEVSPLPFFIYVFSCLSPIANVLDLTNDIEFCSFCVYVLGVGQV